MYYYFFRFSDGSFLVTDHASPEDWASILKNAYITRKELRFRHEDGTFSVISERDICAEFDPYR